jgi:hypothetical protein
MGGRILHRITRPIGCVACHRPIVYGDRCEDCKRRVRQRQRRKPR